MQALIEASRAIKYLSNSPQRNRADHGEIAVHLAIKTPLNWRGFGVRVGKRNQWDQRVTLGGEIFKSSLPDTI
jgi:hypothetical protein